MTDQYAWWRKALEIAGDCRELTRDQQAALGISETDPQAGFFRTRKFKDGPLVPVAIWYDGKWICLRDGQEADAEAVWTYACRNPISEETYHAASRGAVWPDEPPPIPNDHNQVKTGDPYKDLLAEFNAERELAETFLRKPITTQQEADQAAIWSKRLASINKKATDLHKVEKQPSLDEGRRVDDKWRDLKEEPAALAKRLKRHMDAFLIEQDRLEQERQRKARAEADRIRKEAEEAAREAAEKSWATGIAASFEAETNEEADRLERERQEALAKAERLAQASAEAEREAQARNANAGRTGARVSLRTFVSALIVDYDKAVMALKDEPEMRELVQKLANTAVKDGVILEGVERIEEKRAA